MGPFEFIDWTKPIAGYSSSVYQNKTKHYGPENLWDNKLGRTFDEFDGGGDCLHSSEFGLDTVDLDLGSEFNVTAISILNRRDFRS